MDIALPLARLLWNGSSLSARPCQGQEMSAICLAGGMSESATCYGTCAEFILLPMPQLHSCLYSILSCHRRSLWCVLLASIALNLCDDKTFQVNLPG